MGSDTESAPVVQPVNGAIKQHNSGKTMSKLQVLLIVVTGSCFMANAMISLTHSLGTDEGQNLAIHEAMDDFKKGLPAVSKKQNSPNAPHTNAPVSKAAKNSKSFSKIASLSCEKYGGPPKEFAQEMVYWSDVPSDALYVSPLKKKRGNQRQYMTFEPGKFNFCLACTFTFLLSCVYLTSVLHLFLSVLLIRAIRWR